jgi:hypothetical protein
VLDELERAPEAAPQYEPPPSPLPSWGEAAAATPQGAPPPRPQVDTEKPLIEL